ncbi:hypothetical protein BSKO_13555 [Bryopsis sp. KO-2023]|nr:hypothetical protein BSKO_13555 [Bryopsis sp. KO-2023]
MGKESAPGQELPDFPSEAFVANFRRVIAFARRCTPVAVVGWGAWKLNDVVGEMENLQYYSTEFLPISKLNMVLAALLLLVLFFTIIKRVFKSYRPVYLVDFACYKPPQVLKVTRNECRIGAENSKQFSEESLQFQRRIAERAGLGDETYLPPPFHYQFAQGGAFRLTMRSAREEAEMVMFGAVRELLSKSGLAPRDIGILIVNCSLFNPTPSLTAMIVNHFKMRSDITTYNLSGMGCSAGVIAVDLARELLQVYPDKYAIVVSTENITQNWYGGNDRSMLIPNVLFRMGAAAMLMTNKKREKRRAKYELQHVVRVHIGADDAAFRCVYQDLDSDGKLGVELNKDIVKVASKALQKNLTRMGPLVLPWSEFVFLGINLLAAKILKMRVKAYVPDFKTAFDHFCLHAGGRSIIEGLSKQLGLPTIKTDPSFQTLQWYGNTSSSTIWYSLAYIESCQKVKKGDIVWQVGFGSGFKCNSSVWKAIRDVQNTHEAWAHRVGKAPTPPPPINPEEWNKPAGDFLAQDMPKKGHY